MSTAIATAAPMHIAPANPFEPQNLDQAMKLAETVSKSGLVPSALRGKPADILIAVQLGMELGLSPVQALQNIMVVNGRPSMWGDLVMALVKAMLAAFKDRVQVVGQAVGAERAVSVIDDLQPDIVLLPLVALAASRGYCLTLSVK